MQRYCLKSARDQSWVKGWQANFKYLQTSQQFVTPTNAFIFTLVWCDFFGDVKVIFFLFASSEETYRTRVDVNLLTPFAWLFSFSNSKS